MNKLKSLATNPFFTIDVAREMVQNFVFDHIKRLKEHNNPHFAQILIAITTLWEGIFGSIEDYEKFLNAQVSFTQQVKNKMKEFTDKVVIDLEAAVIFKFKKVSTQYDEFFPHGKTEYHNMTLQNALILMDRIVELTTTYASDIGNTLKTEFKTIHDDYDALIESQKGKKEAKGDSASDYEEELLPLYEQLYQNACTILAEYYKKPDRLFDLFDETLVNYVTHIKNVLVQKGGREAYEINFTADNTIVLFNKSGKTVTCFFAETAEATSGTPANELLSKVRKKIKGSEAGAPLNKFLIIVNNTDTDAKIEYRIE